MSNPGLSIGWFPNTKFDGLDTQLLFDDIVFLSVLDNRALKISKNNWTGIFKKIIEHTHKILEVNIYRGNTGYYFQVYNFFISFNAKE